MTYKVLNDCRVGGVDKKAGETVTLDPLNPDHARQIEDCEGSRFLELVPDAGSPVVSPAAPAQP